MTIRQSYPVPNYGTASTSHSHRDDDEESSLSPTDGYFSQRSSVPDTVFIPDTHAESRSPSQVQPQSYGNMAESKPKAEEAGAENGQNKAPGYSPVTNYTPATSATPAGSSRRDSESVYGSGHGSRAVAGSDMLNDDDPPPMYSTTPTDWSSSPSQSQYTDAPASNRVRDATPVPAIFPSQPRASPSLAQSPNTYINFPHFQWPRSMADHPVDLGVQTEAQTPILPGPSSGSRLWRKENRRCFGRRRGHKERSRGRYKHKLCCWTVVVLFMLVWLMVKFAMRHKHRDRFGAHIPHQIPPPSNSTQPTPIPFPSRSYTQHETSHSITGTYDLLDYLELTTTSGSISITVNPKPGRSPAVLKLSSTSGSIKVQFPTGRRVPVVERVYQTTITTHSGSVSGNLVVSGNGADGYTRISTRSGSQVVGLTPIVSKAFDGGAARLSTESGSGSQNIKIADPITPSASNGGVVFSELAGTHVSTGSGSLSIRYPSAWKGIVHATSEGSGHLRASGEGLIFDQKSSKEVYAWRGKPGEEVQTVNIKAGSSGSISFMC